MRSRSVVAYWVVFSLLLAPAGVLTLVRLTDPASEVGVQLQAFTSYAVVPYVLALVLLGWGAWRSTSRHAALLVPVVLVVGGLVLHLVWLAPLLLGEQRAPAAGRGVSLMSTNLFFGRGDGAEVVREVAGRGVDVLVASEVTRDTLAEMEEAGLDTALPYRVGTPGVAVEGTMVFSRTPITPVSTVAGTTFANLVVRTEGMTLVAAHPAAPLDPVAWRDDHAAILAAVVDGAPDVIAGDLNATLDHAPLRALETAGYRDAAELLNSGLGPTWPANGLYGPLGFLPPLVPIDHVVVSSGWTATRLERVEIADTDHLALVADLARAA